ncbi:MAG TPA: SRPBCC family protein [Gemmatimonadales bacterium]|nr:SRPBCC family protein [Gemmatimonadales bacterium]
MAETANARRVYSVSQSTHIDAPPPRIYGLIADYVQGHPRIVPPRYFRDFVVRQGGYGAGTEIEFTMIVAGHAQRVVADITEPIPGRVLVETVKGGGVVTTFRVEPAGQGADVTIATDLEQKPGFAGKIERWLAGRILPGIYHEELMRLAGIAREEPAPEPERAP